MNAADSALPATVLQFTIKNTSSAPAELVLAGRLQNGVCSNSGETYEGVRQNRVLNGRQLAMVLGSARELKTAEAPKRQPILFADFEGQNYGDWTVEGKAFGAKPASGTLPNQQAVTAFRARDSSTLSSTVTPLPASSPPPNSPSNAPSLTFSSAAAPIAGAPA